MKKLSDIITIIVDKTLPQGVGYLVNILSEPVEHELLPCIHCEEPTSMVLCPICKTNLGIFGYRDEAGIAYLLIQGHEVEVTTGWPVLEPVPVHNQ